MRPRIFHSWCVCGPAYVGCAPRGHAAFSLAVTRSWARRSTNTPWDFTSPPEETTVMRTFMPSPGKTAGRGYAMLTFAAPPVIACVALFSLSKTAMDSTALPTLEDGGNTLCDEYHGGFSALFLRNFQIP